MPSSSHTILELNRLQSVSVWEFDDGVEFSQNEFELSEDFADCDFWCAGDGQTYLLKSIGGRNCLANAESALKGLGLSNVYVIWKYKNATLSQWTRWTKKWVHRTSKV